MSSTTEALSPENGEVADEATVRDQFKTVVADRGVALAKIAPETGVHYSTLAAWNSASYSGNNARVTEQIRQWLVTQEARSRMQTALPRAPSFVRTDTALAIIDVLEAAQTLPDIALVTGGAGIGKTMTIGWYQEKAANVWLVTMERSYRSLSALLDQIARVVGVPGGKSSSATSEQIRRRLLGTGGLLVIDEAQFLTGEQVDQLRTFHDKSEVGIAMVGNETIAGRYAVDRLTHDQAPLFSRVGQRFRQRGLKIRDLNMLIDAWGLSDPAAAAMARSAGRLPGAARLMTKTLRMAFLLARNDQRDQPNERDVKLALEQLGGQNQSLGGAA